MCNRSSRLSGFEYVKEGKTTHERVYGITSLGIDQATPQRLLEIVRSHWNIENGLHYRRDETLGKTGVICAWDTGNG